MNKSLHHLDTVWLCLCGCGCVAVTVVVWLWLCGCGCVAVVVWLLCGCGCVVVVVWLWLCGCGCVAVVVWLLCGCGCVAVVVWLWLLSAWLCTLHFRHCDLLVLKITICLYIKCYGGKKPEGRRILLQTVTVKAWSWKLIYCDYFSSFKNVYKEFCHWNNPYWSKREKAV